MLSKIQKQSLSAESRLHFNHFYFTLFGDVRWNPMTQNSNQNFMLVNLGWDKRKISFYSKNAKLTIFFSFSDKVKKSSHYFLIGKSSISYNKQSFCNKPANSELFLWEAVFTRLLKGRFVLDWETHPALASGEWTRTSSVLVAWCAESLNLSVRAHGTGKDEKTKLDKYKHWTS